MVNEIKTVRGELDGLAKGAKSLYESPIDMGGNECLKAYRSILMGKAWLGKVLEGIGNPSPYQNDGKRHSEKDIEKTADVGFCVFPRKTGVDVGGGYEAGQITTADVLYFELNHVEKVDWLRQQIKEYISRVEAVRDKVELTRLLSIAFTNVYNHLSEARFHLGFELQRIKENEKTTDVAVSNS